MKTNDWHEIQLELSDMGVEWEMVEGFLRFSIYGGCYFLDCAVGSTFYLYKVLGKKRKKISPLLKDRKLIFYDSPADVYSVDIVRKFEAEDIEEVIDELLPPIAGFEADTILEGIDKYFGDKSEFLGPKKLLVTHKALPFYIQAIGGPKSTAISIARPGCTVHTHVSFGSIHNKHTEIIEELVFNTSVDNATLKERLVDMDKYIAEVVGHLFEGVGYEL